MSQSGLPHDVVEYPCSDGQPMGESDIHRACMMYVTYALKRHYERGGRADVYVSANSFLYYQQGNPRAAEARAAELEARVRDLESALASPPTPEGPRSRKSPR